MPQQTLASEFVVAALQDDTQLIVDRDLDELVDDPETDSIAIDELDYLPGRVRFHHEDPDLGAVADDMEFKNFVDARLAFGLWQRCGPWTEPETSAVPEPIATAGIDAITAYLYIGPVPGETSTRESVARRFDVQEQTISDRLSRVRWKPEK
jgi:hypothetical protein